MINGDRQTELRSSVERSRRAPRELNKVVAPFAGGGKLAGDVRNPPVELTLEATNGEQELAPWLTDEWWTEQIQRWGAGRVAVHLAPTPGALLHPVIVYQLEMLRRVVPDWRLVGHGYIDDVATDEAVMKLAGSPYHEVRFTEQCRPGTVPPERRCQTMTLRELFGRIRNEQSRLGTTTPILVRLPAENWFNLPHNIAWV